MISSFDQNHEIYKENETKKMNIWNLTISIRDAGSRDAQLSAAPPTGQDV